jgi:DNA-binding transcriptional LysR family regulator
LRISAPLLFSQTALGKLAAGFVRKYPEVRLEITTEDRAVDMIEEAYDVVIRVNPEPDESLVGRVFLHDRLVVVASPDLPRPAGGDAVPAVTRGAMNQAESWEVTTSAGKLRLAARPVLSVSSFIMIRDAVRAGVGAARLPLSLAIPDLSAGGLVSWGEVEGFQTALWALYPTRRLLSPRVSAFLDYLKEAFPRGMPEELAAYME